jgi:hypothetical protein
MLRWKPLVLVSLLTLPQLAAARSINKQACAGTGDADVVLPTDPRTAATALNGYSARWVSCHQPRTFDKCGPWEAAILEGERILKQDAMIGSFWDASVYRDLWRPLGLPHAPGTPEERAEFDHRVRERYGLQPAPFDNPYPLEGETPGTSGGSGQLPMGLIQTKSGNTYTGDIGITCLLCHAGRVNGESRIGLGNSTLDFGVLNADIAQVAGTPLPFPYPINQTRGTVNADSAFEVLQAVRDFDTLDRSPFVKGYPFHPSPGDQDPPNWWNHGSRPRVLMDGGVPADNTRTFTAFLMSAVSQEGAYIRGWEQRFEKIQAYFDSLEPPPYPYLATINPTKVAEGNRIFHEENLFARLDGNDPLRAGQIGNGSCSSCHGIHDASRGTATKPAFVSGQIVPTGVIGTDAARVETATPLGRWVYSTTWFSFAHNEDPSGNRLLEALNDYDADYMEVIPGGR